MCSAEAGYLFCQPVNCLVDSPLLGSLAEQGEFECLEMRVRECESLRDVCYERRVEKSCNSKEQYMKQSTTNSGLKPRVQQSYSTGGSASV